MSTKKKEIPTGMNMLWSNCKGDEIDTRKWNL